MRTDNKEFSRPQAGRRFLRFGSVVLLLGLVALSACAPAVNAADNGEAATSATAAEWGNTFEAHGALISWEADPEDGEFSAYFRSFDPSQRTCQLVATPRFIDPVAVADVAWMVGNCFYHLGLKLFPDSDGVVVGEDRPYSNTYSAAYIEKCGELLQPLGWPDAADGECDLPDPEQVLRDHYGIPAG